MRAGVIDLGSNSALLLIGEIKEGSHLPEILYEDMMTTRLGEGVNETGVISEDRMDRTVEVLTEFKRYSEEYDVEVVRTYGTSVFREAKNTDEVLKKVMDEVGIPIEVISAEEEGELSYLSATVSTKKGKAVVIDVGAMSAQISWGFIFTLVKTMSFPLGCVLLSEKFGLYNSKSPAELEEVSEFIRAELGALPSDRLAEYETITVGGSAVAVGAMLSNLTEYDREQIQGMKVKREQIEKQYKNLFKKPGSERRSLTPFEPERGAILPAGLLVIDAIHKLLRSVDTTICWWGLTYGMLLKVKMELTNQK
jgi:exopolyphosphatase/guanosine-5'-triphosphate,3'-diphosphate pyrophosphatase